MSVILSNNPTDKAPTTVSRVETVEESFGFFRRHYHTKNRDKIRPWICFLLQKMTVDMFPQTYAPADINRKVSSHVETVVLLSRESK